MPVSTSSRSSTAYTALASTPTPSRSHPSWPMSPPSINSYSPTVTSVGQVAKMNIVTRVVIEGKAKQGQDGASIKMYMKLSIPVDSVTPGSTIALFPEENVKILTSQIHPLDNNSAPYNFSSAASPLLHNAARALNLPARLPTAFNATFRLSSTANITSPTASTSHVSESELTTASLVDPQYTGQILVSGYHIAYVLPRQFPSQDHSRLEVESERSSHPFHQKRRLSLGDRIHAHFMAGVDMWVPYVTRPPRSPYLLSIPTPRCLQNNIRLRIPPPSNTTSSFASLSSLEDDANTWDLTSDPHVTRTVSNRLSRAGSYNHFADDESSDSSTNGFPDGFGIQGTFPSTDRVRVRWAKPMKSFDETTGGDTRRKVGVKDAKSEMICTVRERKKSDNDETTEGIVMDVEYKASCKGIWFPGVATLLGMDVGLVAKNSDVRWLEGQPSEWNVSGGVGYTGFNIAGEGPPDNRLPSRTSSMDSPLPRVHTSPSSGGVQAPQANGRPGGDSSSTSSLLRAPLPSQNVVEYSFEGLNDPSASTSSNLETLSSVSLSQSVAVSHPGAPLTLHLNMNEILPPNKSPFTFTITGTILIIPRTSLSRANSTQDSSLDYTEITEPVSLPHFTVLAADAETTKFTVRNEVNCSNTVMEVYSPSGDIYRDPQTRKTVLQKGGSTRCGADGGRIALKTIRRTLSGQPRTQIDNSNPLALFKATRPLNTTPHVLVGPPIIPSVTVIVTPLLSRRGSIPDVYTARIHLNVPVNTETNWLEFGLARVGPSTSRTPLHHNGETQSPKVHIAGASVDGVPVQYAITNAEKRFANGEALHGASFETMDSTEWANWAKFCVGPSSGSRVVIDYIVKTEPTKPSWVPSWNKRQRWNLLLPTFTLPVRTLEIKLERSTGFMYSKVYSNLEYQHPHPEGERLFHFTQDDIFSPRVFVELSCARAKNPFSWPSLPGPLLWICILLSALVLQRFSQEFPRMRVPPDSHTNYTNLDVLNDVVTVTTTMVNTVTHCPSISLQPAKPTTSLYLSSSHVPPPISASYSPAPPPAPTSVPSITSEPAISSAITPPPQNSLSTAHSFTSVLEMLGLNRVQDTLDSVVIPDLKLSVAKEKLIQYGTSVWEIIWDLFF